jgi:hypothetical protein
MLKKCACKFSTIFKGLLNSRFDLVGLIRWTTRLKIWQKCDFWVKSARRFQMTVFRIHLSLSAPNTCGHSWKSSHQNERNSFFPSDFQLLAVVTCIFIWAKFAQIPRKLRKFPSCVPIVYNLSHSAAGQQKLLHPRPRATGNQSHIFSSRAHNGECARLTVCVCIHRAHSTK